MKEPGFRCLEKIFQAGAFSSLWHVVRRYSHRMDHIELGELELIEALDVLGAHRRLSKSFLLRQERIWLLHGRI